MSPHAEPLLRFEPRSRRPSRTRSVAWPPTAIRAGEPVRRVCCESDRARRGRMTAVASALSDFRTTERDHDGRALARRTGCTVDPYTRRPRLLSCPLAG